MKTAITNLLNPCPDRNPAARPGSIFSTGAAGAGRDVTQERATREALREREELLRTIVEHAPAGVAIAGLEHRLIRVNPAFARLVGYSEAELQGMAVDRFTHEDDRPKNGAVFHDLFTGKPGPISINKRYRRKDGTIVWVRVTVALVRGPQGELRCTLALVEDVSDRKQKEDHLRLIINTIPTMAWSVLPDGTVDFVNQRWLEYSGLSLEQALGEPTRTVHPDDLPRVMEKGSAEMAAGNPSEDEMRLRRADGEYRWFLIRTAPLRDDSGKIVKWYGVSTDIHDRKEAEVTLRRNQAFFAAEAHRIGRLLGTTVPGHQLEDPASDEAAIADQGGAPGRSPPGTGVSAEAIRADHRVVAERQAIESLTSKERAIIRLITEGRSNAKVGELLHLSPRTVETYRARLMQKLHLEDLPALVKLAIRHGLASVD